jgi:site-specific recombinase XerD
MNQIELLTSDFISSRQAKEGTSPKTIVNYRMALDRVLMPYVEKRKVTKIDQVTRQFLVDLAISLQKVNGRNGRPLSPATRNSYLRQINVFLNWVRAEVDEVHLPLNAKARTSGLIAATEPPLTEQDFNAMLKAASTKRDEVILEVLWETGMRAGELCSIRTNSIINHGRGRQFLRVRGKGGLTKMRDREVPLIKDGLLRKVQAVADSQPRGVKTDHVFVSRRRRNGKYQPLGESGLTQLIDSIAKQAELSRRRVFPHLFRHTAITRMLKEGNDPYVVSKMVGTSLQMIDKVYGHLIADDVYDLVRENGRRRHSAA